MKLFKKVLLFILCAILIAGVWFIISQASNIKAVFYYLQHRGQQSIELEEKNNRLLFQELENYPEITVRDLTEEEKSAFFQGTLSKEELVKRLVSKASPDPFAENASTDPSSQEDNQPSSAPEGAASSGSAFSHSLSEKTAEFLILRASYIHSLKNLEAETSSEYQNTPGNKLSAISIVTQYFRKAGALEKQSDEDVNACLAEISRILSNNERSTTLVNTLRRVYEDDKNIHKAFYIDRYL